MTTNHPIIFYHPGSRGDFLGSILYGNRLLEDENNAMVHHPGYNGVDVSFAHWYSDDQKLVCSASDFNKFMSIKISMDTLEEQKQVACLMLVKHSVLFNFEITNDKKSGAVASTAEWVTMFKDVKFDVVVPFKNLFCIDYLSQLCADLSTPLTDEEKTRIQNNININLDILNGPW